jgi:hypothetical protein
MEESGTPRYLILLDSLKFDGSFRAREKSAWRSLWFRSFSRSSTGISFALLMIQLFCTNRKLRFARLSASPNPSARCKNSLKSFVLWLWTSDSQFRRRTFHDLSYGRSLLNNVTSCYRDKICAHARA